MMSAPYAISVLTTSLSPFCSAMWRGVTPLCVGRILFCYLRIIYVTFNFIFDSSAGLAMYLAAIAYLMCPNKCARATL